MKYFDIHTILVFALLAGFAFSTTQALAASKCDSPQSMIDKRACEKAAAGAEDLRRFVERTRTIYGLYYYDFAKEDRVPAAPTQPTQVGELTSPKP